MDTDRIELIVLDLDGTLYDINDVISKVYQYQVSFLSAKLNKPFHEIESFFASRGIYPVVSRNSRSATELFAQLGVDNEEWKEYRNMHFDVTEIQIENAVGEEVINDLTMKRKVVLLSSNTMSTVEKILFHLDISKKFFSEIICSDNFHSERGFNKRDAMKYISDKYNIPFSSMLSIGDRYQTDIRPMIELGGVGVLITSPKNLMKVVKDLDCSRLMNCIEYELFRQ